MSRRDVAGLLAIAAPVIASLLGVAVATGCVRASPGSPGPEPPESPVPRDRAAPVAAGSSVDTVAASRPEEGAREGGGEAPAEPAAGGRASAADAPSRYPDGTVHSPITESVARRLRAIRDLSPHRQEQVFMKVGSSETVDLRYLRCFSGAEGSPFVVDLGGAGHLQATLEHFRRGDARGRNPFVRASEATKVGQSAAWAYAGARPPIAREIAAIDPAWAIVAFGSNDLNHGVSPLAALWPYHQHLAALIDRVVAAGVVPIVMGPSPRGDSKAAAQWVVVYDDVTRAIAESRQVPFVDLVHASASLPGRGLVKDGVHGNVFTTPRNGRQPCILSAEGLQYHYNVRNLVTLEALDRARRAGAGDATAIEAPRLPAIRGGGTEADPYVVDRFPFSHARAVEAATPAAAAAGLEGDQAVSGIVYRLDLDEARALRIMAFHGAGAGVRADLCVTGPDPAAGGCLARHDRTLAGTLPAGTYRLVVATAPDRRGRRAPGELLTVIDACPADAQGCAGPLR